MLQMKTVLLLLWLSGGTLSQEAKDDAGGRIATPDANKGIRGGDDDSAPLDDLIRLSPSTSHQQDRVDKVGSDNDPQTSGATFNAVDEPNNNEESNKRGGWVAPAVHDASSPMREVDDQTMKEGENKRLWGLDEKDSDEGDQAAFKKGENNQSTLGTKESGKRIWGTAPPENATQMKTEKAAHPATETTIDVSSTKIPLTKSKTESHSPSPPDGFAIKARVYIDPTDKLAHLSTDLPHIPYWDCGVTGSTTSPLPLKNAYFRHALSGATYWAGTDGKHAVLMVSLKECLLELNSGESMALVAGDIVLLEDVLKPGHKVKPLDHGEISVLFMTLPQPYYHTGKDHLSLPNTFVKPSRRRDPCPTSGADSDATPELMANPEDLDRSSRDNSWTAQRMRRIILGIFGFSASTLTADWLGKVAPLWVAVGIGGTCFVTGVTWTIINAGDALLTQFDVYREKRKLQLQADDENLVIDLKPLSEESMVES